MYTTHLGQSTRRRSRKGAAAVEQDAVHADRQQQRRHVHHGATGDEAQRRREGEGCARVAHEQHAARVQRRPGGKEACRPQLDACKDEVRGERQRRGSGRVGCAQAEHSGHAVCAEHRLVASLCASSSSSDAGRCCSCAAAARPVPDVRLVLRVGRCDGQRRAGRGCMAAFMAAARVRPAQQRRTDRVRGRACSTGWKARVRPRAP
jgi:hypothetical protein